MNGLLLALTLLAPPAAASQPTALVVCAPGYPGTAAEAQPRMDRLAVAVARAARLPEGSLTAVYEPSERGGVQRLLHDRGAGLAMVPLPFLVAHGDELKLRPRLLVSAHGEAEQAWTLVAKKGRVRSAADLASFSILSVAGYSPAFVRGALREWGALPDSTRITASSQVLSALRKAAGGEDVAVLLDGTQAAALSSLPFAGELDVVTKTAPLPSAFVCSVADRIPEKRWAALERAFTELGATPDGQSALRDLEMDRFVRAPEAAAATARRIAAAGARK